MIQALRTEAGVFESRLPPPVQRLFRSNVYLGIADAFANVFIGAFIWYATGSLLSVGLYYLAQCTFLPVAFWVNGLLLRRFTIQSLFFVGSALSGLSTLGIVLFTGAYGPLAFLLLGAVYGFGTGIYWPNRNYLELQELEDGSRNYYFGAMHAVTGITGVFVPLIAGWFIALGRFTDWYSVTQAYWIIFGLSFLLLLVVGGIVARGTYATPRPARITRFSVRPLLNRRRSLAFVLGLVNAWGFIVPVLVLLYLGSEGILGTLTAAAALFVSLCMYAYGRFGSVHQRYQLTLLSSFAFLGSTVVLAFVSQPLGVLAYVLLSGPARQFFFTGIEPIILAETDREMDGDTESRYSFIVDNEVFLNLGRVCTALFVIGAALLLSTSAALFYAPLIIGIVQVLLFGVLYRVRG